MPVPKPISTFGPRLRPHAERIDKNIGDGDGMLSHAELEEYRRRFPQATEYLPLKEQLGPAGELPHATSSTGGPVNVGGGAGVLGFLLGRSYDVGKGVTPGPVTTRLPDGDYNLSAFRSDAAARAQLPPAPPDLVSYLQKKHPHIPVEDLLAVRAYSAKEYGRINAALDGAGDLYAVLAFIKCAASGLGALPSFVGTVYRGAVMSTQAMARYRPGAVVAERRFTSASALATFPESWRAGACNVVFVIQSRATGHSVAHLSAKPEEAEVLFTPGTQFRVLRNEYDPLKKRTSIYLDEHA